MNKNKLYLLTLPIQFAISTIVIMGILGCSNNPVDRMESAKNSFTNMSCEVRATTYTDQYIVRAENGSIWEIRVKTELSTRIAPIFYKNCLFDALYSLPPKPLAPPQPPLSLERN